MNLAAEMAKLPKPETEKRPPEWAYWRLDLWRRAQQDEPHDFTQWPSVYHTMLVNQWPAQIEIERRYVTERIGHSAIASMLTPVHDYFDFGSLARNYVHQAYHILRWQEATGLNIADMGSIYEFGGGYGAMALVCNRLGFKGEYHIYDLPEFALLQQWYLGECGVNNVEWVKSDSYGDVDLLIACYSLSETDFNERDRILVAWPANSYLFLYSNKFEQYDNIAYFQRPDYGKDYATKPLNPPDTMMAVWEKHPRCRWQHSHIEHLPPESWYTWGWRNDAKWLD